MPTNTTAVFNPKPWEVWRARVSYADQPAKNKHRPVLVLPGGAAIPIQALMGTSQGWHAAPSNKAAQPDAYYELQHWEAAGLEKATWIVLDRNLELMEPDFKNGDGNYKKYGHLHILDQQNIQNRLLANQANQPAIL